MNWLKIRVSKMSNIQAKLVEDNLTLNIVDILSSLSGEQEKQLIEQLSCSDAIIEHVTSQIVNGLTENGYSGYVGCNAEPSTALDMAIRTVAESSSGIAKCEIKKLQTDSTRYHVMYREWMGKYYDLERNIVNSRN